MIKVDLVNDVSKLADLTKVKAEVAVDAVFDAMRLSLQRGERIELRGFGVFLVKPRKRGIGRNPRTGQEVPIPPGRTIRFRPGKDLRNIGLVDNRCQEFGHDSWTEHPRPAGAPRSHGPNPLPRVLAAARLRFHGWNRSRPSVKRPVALPAYPAPGHRSMPDPE